jgi:ketosteroid isomerase-like protein
MKLRMAMAFLAVRRARAPMILGVAMAAASCGGSSTPPPAPDPAQVVAAERAFAQAGTDSGVTGSFSAFSAPDGILFRPGPVNGPEWLATANRRTGPPHLQWWPVYAGIANSGDLGFTTGPWEFGDGEAHGFYFTIWKKQPDGTWRFLLDHGPQHEGPSEFGRDAAVTYLAPSTGDMKGIDADRALERVRAHEATMAGELAADARAAYRKWLTPDALTLGSPVPPTLDGTGQTAEIERRPEAMTVSALGGGASEAGDLVYTYGNASWKKADGSAASGHYLRLWQFRENDWRVVIDEVIEAQGG